MNTRNDLAPASGVALLAVLFALTLLALLALPFAVSMGVGAEAATRDVEKVQAEQASASVRDLLRADAALSHPAFDPTPTFDTLAEFPDRVELPAAFKSLAEDGKVLLGGEVWDLQRFLGLDSVSPLVLGNLIGTATRLREPLLPDATSMELEDAEALPDSGMLWIAHELIRYAKKQDNTLQGLQRALHHQDLLFADGKNPIDAGTLVFDYRCVMAVAWPFMGRADATRQTRRPYASVSELVEFRNCDVLGNPVPGPGIGSFSAAELDLLQQALSVDTMATTAATWGRPERLFNKLEGGKSKSLRVKKPLHIGAGSTIRLTNLRTGTVEYALVMRTVDVRNAPDLQMPSVYLELLLPVLQSYPDIDTLVEPLVPAPVNVNTASASVLTALFSEVRIAPTVLDHSTAGVQGSGVPAITRSQARELADAIVVQRSAERGSSSPGGPAMGPFEGWRDIAERLMKPRFAAASTSAAKTPWIVLYRNLLTGRDSMLEMGTAPICFLSGPWVGYRAAASRSRSTVAPGVASRHERTGLAAAMPGLLLEREWNTQEVFEEAFQLDRRAPFWITTPVNLGALNPGDVTNDPASRHLPHVLPLAYPDFGLGEARFPAKDATDSGLRPACSLAPSGNWGNSQGVPGQHGYESFWSKLDPRGYDVSKDGPYQVRNTGPRGGGAGSGQSSSNNRHDLSFPFANSDSFMDRLAVSFWLEPKSLEGVTLFDHSVGDPERNRLSLQGKDGKLLLEVIDEAGLDPDPSQSPAGIERTAVEWSLPLAELGLQADTPVHVNIGAYAGRPSDLSVALDGMTRGKAKYTTYLTAPLPVYDPTLRANTNRRAPGQRGDEKYLDLQVESTEGFPPVGIVRIGLELFEYSGISGNTLQCQWKDSLGGRGARQDPREHHPNVPVDSNGKPTVDIETLNRQGVNLDVYPAHPVGSLVEVFGYAALLSEDTPMMKGETQLGSAVGGWAVARGCIDNPRPISISLPSGGTLPLGNGIEATWVGELQLANPVKGEGLPLPPAAQPSICDAFPTTGGYALLLQRRLGFDGSQLPGQPTGSTSAGGIEVIRYAARQGNKLTGVQRAQRLPGQDNQIESGTYDGSARQFVTDWTLVWGADPRLTFDDIPTLILWVIPLSVPVANASAVWDPDKTGLSEWVQLYPRGSDVNDTEWVRYDAIADNRHLVRANRAAWRSLYWTLVRTYAIDIVRVTGSTGSVPPGAVTDEPWDQVEATSGYIGYIPRVEADFDVIHAARGALEFRGDPATGTSSHAQSNSVVTACQRLQLNWGNYGALTGRVGRHDRVTLIKGSVANGSARPDIEWHTVTWQMRRFESDVSAQNQTPVERLGPKPFQLVAFTDGVHGDFLGPPRNTQVDEPRKFDRVVKFPSGELPAAYCENVAIGGGVGNVQPMQGIVDEVEVMNHIGWDLLVDEPFTAAAKTFRVNRAYTYNSAGWVWSASDRTQTYPRSGGLLLIDNEIIAYKEHADGQFTVATNGRGLLNTEPKDHDQGARVHFLTHRPAAILTGAVSNRDNTLPVQALGAMPAAGGTALFGRELLHYTWVRTEGDKVSLEMPRWVPPGETDTSSGARGLFRGRFGTAVQSGSTGEPVIMFPFRYWDRYFERTDDPELAYFQLTATETPVFYRTLRWREETQDARVGVVCLARTDSKVPWDGVPGAGGLWLFKGSSASAPPHRIAAQAARIEIRFATEYRPGVLDLESFRAHGWKMTARVEDVRLEYEGQGRVFDEQVTAR